jgi:hypothetical protein
MYHQGHYHLFYQYNPEGPVWGNIVWHRPNPLATPGTCITRRPMVWHQGGMVWFCNNFTRWHSCSHIHRVVRNICSDSKHGFPGQQKRPLSSAMGQGGPHSSLSMLRKQGFSFNFFGYLVMRWLQKNVDLVTNCKKTHNGCRHIFNSVHIVCSHMHSNFS